jgi:aldose sugar dehydrogenase
MKATLLLAALLTSSLLAEEKPDYTKMKAEQIFAQLCSSCHGEDLSNGVGGSLIDGEWKHGSSDVELMKSIKDGNSQLGMTAFGTILDDRQIRSLVIHIREKEKQAKERGVRHPKPELGKVTQTQHEDYKIEMVVASGLKDPWAITFLPDGRKLVTEKAGRLRVISAAGQLLPEPVKGTPQVIEHGQGGMMEVPRLRRWQPGGRENEDDHLLRPWQNQGRRVGRAGADLEGGAEILHRCRSALWHAHRL